MALIEETIDVKVPLYTAYDQWTQFENFPRFMEGVDQVQQLNETTLEWRATVGGIEKVCQARIVEQVPDQRITWISTAGARNDGTVSFSVVDADRTRVNLLIEVDPDGPLEELGTVIGVLRRRIRGDLGRFRDFIEATGTETGAWRGEVPAGSDEDSLDQADTRSPNPGWPGLPRPATLDPEPAGGGDRSMGTTKRSADTPGSLTPEDVPGIRSSRLNR